MTPLTIVTYHYVRDLARSRYPEIKGLSVEAFEGQLDYIARYYRVCSVRDVIAAVRTGRALPPNACVLTFDDGLIDHFTVVYPRLAERGWPGAFFPPVAAAAGGRVLDTHKIQLVLAAARDEEGLARRLRDLLARARRDTELPSAEALWERYARPSRFGDSAEVIFVKRVLQRGLPDRVRAMIAAALFEEYVGISEAVVARELYVDAQQLRCMLAHGMDIGGHGAEHVWLDSLDAAAQAEEIHRTRAFLAELHGGRLGDWVMCYPFGNYDAETLGLLAAAGGALGLTTDVGLAHDLTSPLTLPRLDTNDLPRRGDADPNDWTARALGAEAAR